jgi:hypothetical protein
MIKPTEKDAERCEIDGINLPGLEIGIAMLEEMERVSASTEELPRYSLEKRYRPPGTAQENIVQHFLDEIRRRGERALEEGFTSLLTEYICSCVGGGVPDAEFYRKLMGKARASTDADFQRFLGRLVSEQRP